MSTYDRKETDNPLLDEIVYNVKLMIKTCLLKNEHEADLAENETSFKDSRRYIAVIENRDSFSMWDDYTQLDFYNAGIKDTQTLNKYLCDYDLIPDPVKNIIANVRAKRFLNEYVEYNEYYRKICGLPPLKDPGVFITKDDLDGNDINCDFDKPLHEWDHEDIITLKNYGILDNIIKKYPNKYYLKNIDKNISIYNARKAEDYSLLYVDTSLEGILVNRFRDLIEVNRQYIIKLYVDEAYRLYNDYYDRFMIMLIIANTICQMVSEMPEYFIRKDLFDIRTCQYFFEANGVEFFPEIPLKYQIKLVQNLNNLCKYKSTEKNLLTIADIFGYGNIQIYQYYLNKFRVQDNDGNYIKTGNIDEEYDLRFIKVPLGENVDNYIKNNANYVDYYDTTTSDPYWSGPYDRNFIKHGILEKEFNTVKTKYLSVDTIYSLTELTFQMAYFNNMIMYSKVDLSRLNFEIPGITPMSNIVDIFAFLFSLGYWHNNYSDNILYTVTGVLTCKGFNFEANLDILRKFCEERYYTFEDLGIDKFIIPNYKIATIEQLMKIFINNKKIYEAVQKKMYSAITRREFECYEKILESLFITQVNYDKFFIQELNRHATTYTEYLQYHDTYLYNSVIETQELYNPDPDATNEDMKNNIYKKITATTDYLQELLNSEEVIYIFNNLPRDTASAVMVYMQKVINFFKSYKITMINMQNVYLMDDDYVHITDECYIYRTETKDDYVHISDDIFINANITFNDKVSITDDIDIVRYYENK